MALCARKIHRPENSPAVGCRTAVRVSVRVSVRACVCAGSPGTHKAELCLLHVAAPTAGVSEGIGGNDVTRREILSRAESAADAAPGRVSPQDRKLSLSQPRPAAGRPSLQRPPCRGLPLRLPSPPLGFVPAARASEADPAAKSWTSRSKDGDIWRRHGSRAGRGGRAGAAGPSEPRRRRRHLLARW